MSEYKGIKGFQVQTRTEDPSPTEAQAGDFYYNSSTGQFKNIITGGVSIGTWSSGGSLNNAYSQRAGGGIQTSAICAGGLASPSTSPRTRGETELYNGSTWTESGDLNTDRRYVAGAGSVNTAALAIGGYTTNYVGVVESFNGSSWTEITDLNTSRATYAQAAGTQTAAMTMGGNNPSNIALAEIWNGSTWTEVNDMNTARSQAAAGGVTTDAIVFGGATSPEAQTEIYNGSSWSEQSDLNTGRQDLGGSGSSSPNALAVSGYTTDNVANVESWDGSSWSEISDVATARRENSPGVQSANTSSIIYAGFGPNYSTATEEFTAAEFQIKTVTTS